MNDERIRSLLNRFPAGVLPRVFQAPGRVNLIGEHTDYNDGFVMPAAIDYRTQVAAAPRSDSRLVVYSVTFDEKREFDLAEAHPRPQRHWSDYVFGVAVALCQAGYLRHGAELIIDGDVPIAAGVSSSAAIEIATALALTTIHGESVGRAELARICQRAENEFVGARCGIMDQFIALHGVAGHALLLDCRSLQFEAVPAPRETALVICNTMVRHAIAGGEYNLRRAQCEEGVRILRRSLPQIRALRDVTPEQLEQHRRELNGLVHRRCRHVVSEDQRVLQARDAFERGDLARIGLLMAESHRSLRDDYEVSCPELDLMVELAGCVRGTIGARMTGGGFGGCTVNLVHHEHVEEFRAFVARTYEEKTGRTPEIYVSPAANGAGEVSLSAG